jgi:cyclohexadienyl dehydratase
MRILSLLVVLIGLFAGASPMAQVKVSATAPNSIPEALSSRLERVQTARVVRVCIWPDYYGITYRNPKTQQLSGLDFEMAQELGKDLGVSVDFVDSSFAKLVDDLLQDRCDVAMFAVGITPERQKRLRFTRPHLASDIFAVTSKTNQRIRSWADIDREGSVVAVAQGTLHEPIMKARLKQAQLVILNTPFAREQEVQAGRADVFMTDYPYSQRFLANADWARLVAPDSTYHVTPYGYAVAPGDDRWLARLDQFVGAIQKDGRLQAAAHRYRLEPILVH